MVPHPSKNWRFFMENFDRAVLFVNGELADSTRLAFLDTDYFVAVDNGVRHTYTFNLIPHLLIGDLDSIDPDLVEILLSEKVKIQKFPTNKDETDLELALNYVIGKGFSTILLVGALGGRIDQSLANLDLLTREDLADFDIRMDDGRTAVFVIKDSVSFKTTINDTISLIPVCRPATGITTQGLAYPLTNETLYPKKTRGISNTAVANQVSITLEEGHLLCIHLHR
jgi:thiamine pyrophosphokinase